MSLETDLEGKKVVVCTKCDGSGMSKAYPDDSCWTCHGSGYIVVDYPVRICSTCKGTGWLYSHTCSSCRGCGYRGRHDAHLAIDKNGEYISCRKRKGI